ncbi:hypothetical protein [Chitinimonas koreensis]|uniref:hypothetical protein n=1 Tax=Chitinimonas koreensis TaxID=356302 RepID=UPI0012F9A9B2|nr:hypothetical protein [Chitinimonas koreensis]QNM95271.1 hypothetical protein H9L41_15480 [Chitinimonas koreensis]
MTSDFTVSAYFTFNITTLILGCALILKIIAANPLEKGKLSLFKPIKKGLLIRAFLYVLAMIFFSYSCLSIWAGWEEIERSGGNALTNWKVYAAISFGCWFLFSPALIPGILAATASMHLGERYTQLSLPEAIRLTCLESEKARLIRLIALISAPVAGFLFFLLLI